MRFCAALFACCGFLTAQITIPAGEKREIVLRIPVTRNGDMIDVLTSDSSVHVTCVLPDGREITQNNAKEAGMAWNKVTESQAKSGEQVIAGNRMSPVLAALAREHRLPIVGKDAHFRAVDGLRVMAW